MAFVHFGLSQCTTRYLQSTCNLWSPEMMSCPWNSMWLIISSPEVHLLLCIRGGLLGRVWKLPAANWDTLKLVLLHPSSGNWSSPFHSVPKQNNSDWQPLQCLPSFQRCHYSESVSPSSHACLPCSSNRNRKSTAKPIQWVPITKFLSNSMTFRR